MIKLNLEYKIIGLYQEIENYLSQIDYILIRIIQITKKELKKTTNPITKRNIHRELITHEQIKNSFKKTYKKIKEITTYSHNEPKLFDFTALSFQEKEAKDFLEKLNQLMKNYEIPEQMSKDYENLRKNLKNY